MLFNSAEFIFGFLPLTWLVFNVVGRRNSVLNALIFLTFASLVFYAWWDVPCLFILIGSILFNFYIGRLLSYGSWQPRLLLIVGIVSDLLLLMYFKYFDFLVANINALFGARFPIVGVALPLGISFFTFQQISYRMECYRGQRQEDSFLEYVTCVTFFPHLIAGPIVLYQELIPQLRSNIFGRIDAKNVATGIFIFIVGLSKKVLVADNLASIASPTFNALPIETWWPDYIWATVSYGLQIYYDFSGYCDMAVGLGCLFGIRLPINFNSPYMADSIIDFWRRWHITLGRFLRDYLYIPLGGNRGGQYSKLKNLLFTMILGGLWHGASWTFVVWGALHGVALIVNHIWRDFVLCLPKVREVLKSRMANGIYIIFCRVLTIGFVFMAWVYFRSSSVSNAHVVFRYIAKSMGLPFHELTTFSIGHEVLTPYERIFYLSFIGGAMVVAVALPNLYRLLGEYSPGILTHSSSGDFQHEERLVPAYGLAWARPGLCSGVFLGLIFFAVLKSFVAAVPSEFLYFNF